MKNISKILTILACFALLLVACSGEEKKTSDAKEDIKVEESKEDKEDSVNAKVYTCMTTEEPVELSDEEIAEFFENEQFEDSTEDSKRIKSYRTLGDDEYSFTMNLMFADEGGYSGCYVITAGDDRIDYEGNPFIFTHMGGIRHKDGKFIYSISVNQFNTVNFAGTDARFVYDSETDELAFDEGDEDFNNVALMNLLKDTVKEMDKLHREAYEDVFGSVMK